MDAKTVIDAILLGIVEGVTEFLPVSSTAHLLLAGRVLGFNGPAAFDILIQLGAILALFTVYASRLWQLLIDLPGDANARRFVLGIVIAFLPSAILGVLFHRIITGVLFHSVATISVALIVGGVALLLVDRMRLRPHYIDMLDYPLRLALGIGLFQCLSLIPGTSRSGATIVGALLLGTDKRSAAEYSFFLAMPTMLGAFVFEASRSLGGLSGGDIATISIGFIVAFLSALVVVRGLLTFVSAYGFAPFGWWRIAIGIVGLASAAISGAG